MVTFPEKILNGKLYSLCNANKDAMRVFTDLKTVAFEHKKGFYFGCTLPKQNLARVSATQNMLHPGTISGMAQS